MKCKRKIRQFSICGRFRKTRITTEICTRLGTRFIIGLRMIEIIARTAAATGLPAPVEIGPVFSVSVSIPVSVPISVSVTVSSVVIRR